MHEHERRLAGLAQSKSWFCRLSGTTEGKNDPIIEQMRAVSTVTYH